MSAFYGTLQGCRGEATRQGSMSSGIKASAQSYDGSVITYLDYNHDGELMVRIALNDDSKSYGDTAFNGTFAEFKKLLESARK